MASKHETSAKNDILSQLEAIREETPNFEEIIRDEFDIENLDALASCPYTTLKKIVTYFDNLEI